MENLPIFKSENATLGDKLKGKDVAVGIAGRKKLAEITNLQCMPKFPSQSEKMQAVSLSAKDFILQLQNENMGLKKALVDRTKLIEASRIEIHKLTSNLEKVQIQNVQLAQSNSQLLQELNSGKDRLKALQHELGCKNGLLKALHIKLQEKALPLTNLNEAEINKTASEGVSTQMINKNEDEVQDGFNPSDCMRPSLKKPLSVSTKAGVRKKATSLESNVGSSLPRRQSMRLKSDVSQTSDDVLVTDTPLVITCPVTTDQACESTSGALDTLVRKVGDKNKAVNQDACSRRQSRRFRLAVTQTIEDVCEPEKVQTSACIATAETARDGDSNVSKSAVKGESIEIAFTASTGSHLSHRHSTGRPLRHAAVRIQSYKEGPINVKMRRNE